MAVDERARTTVRRGRTTAAALALLTATALLVACDASEEPPRQEPEPAARAVPTETPTNDTPPRRERPITLAFAGDVHFEIHLAQLLDPARPGKPLGPITPALKDADFAMLNLESAIATGGRPERKQYTFRTSPEALRLLAEAGVDVVTMANNHGADYGRRGLRETFAAIEDAPLGVVGIGRDRDAAAAPYRTTVKGTTISAFGVSTRPEHTAKNFTATDTEPGIAVSLEPRPWLLEAVREADEAGDVVVVYLHWGQQLRPCPTPRQGRLARALAQAGADIIVGSHAHVLLGSGWLGDAYVSYGLADFIWYHTYRPETGVLTVRVKDGEVVRDRFTPADIQPNGLPFPLTGDERRRALRAWDRLRTCTDLSATPE